MQWRFESVEKAWSKYLQYKHTKRCCMLHNINMFPPLPFEPVASVNLIHITVYSGLYYRH